MNYQADLDNNIDYFYEDMHVYVAQCSEAVAGKEFSEAVAGKEFSKEKLKFSQKSV